MRHTLLLAPLALALAATLPAQSAPLPSPPLKLGAAWYPEQWPESRWEADLVLMEKAHLHVARVGEFAWSSMEPTEGHYDLDWLERAINLAGKHGVAIVLGTPTATPPAWLTQKYPDVLRIDENGKRVEHGNRLQYDWSSPRYRAFSRAIVEQLAKRFGHNPNVIGWQIDNEISQTSTSDGAREQFQNWLRTQYKTLDALNARWTTTYWSQSYTDWSQIPIPKHGGIDSGNPGLLLNWRRFISATWVDYVRNQTTVIRHYSDPRQFITTNTMGFFVYYDHYPVENELDLAAWDNYVPDGKVDFISNGAAHDLTRGFKRKNFWVMETQPGFVNWSSVNVSLPKGGIRALVWHDVAHGADSVSFWQWRSALNGQEQYHGTLVGADGTPVPLYPEVQQIGEEFDRVGPALADTTVEADIALLHSYESRWAIEWQPHTYNFDPIAELVRYYRPLHQLTQAVDIVSPAVDLSRYKLVVAPAMNLLTANESANLIQYVQQGGNLVLGPRSGMKDGDNSLQPNRQPGGLTSLLGGRVEQFYALKDNVPVEGIAGKTDAAIWAELLSTSSPDTQVLMTYGKSNGWLDGKPAMLFRKVGKGSIAYIGTTFDEPTMMRLAQWMLATSGAEASPLQVPAGVDANVRTGPHHAVHILVNFSDTEQQIALPKSMRDLLHGGEVKTVHLSSQEVAVLDERK